MERLRKVVYTVVTGKNYELREPKRVNKDWDYICFSNTNRKSKHWRIVKVEEDLPDSILSRKVKLLNDFFLPGYDLSVYIDSKFTVKVDLDDFVKRYKSKSNIFFMTHNKRSCLYDEADFCIKNGIGDSSKIAQQIGRYKSEGCPTGIGLFAGGIIIRDHNIESQKGFLEEWFDEIQKGSCRDQISLAYLIWKNSLKFETAPFRKIYDMFK